MNKEQFFVPTIEVLKFSENNAILTASAQDPTVKNPNDNLELPDDE